MFKNNLKLIVRKLQKEKLFTLVNVLGLTIGLTAFLMISLYIRHELSFDKFHKDYENIYRVTSKYQERETRGTITSDYVEFFKDDVIGLNSYSRVSSVNQLTLISGGGKELNTSGVLSVDPNFFEFFSFQLKDGFPSTVLATSGSAVISESLSLKLFGNENPIGKELTLEKGKELYTITGVALDPPLNSSFSFELVTFIEGRFKNNWEQTSSLKNVVTYLNLRSDVSIDEAIGQIDDAKVKPPYNMMSKEVKYGLSPMADQRLFADYLDPFFEQNDIRYIQLFGCIALVVLILAIINYVNLVTAQATKKVREVGLRKIIGAGRYQLMAYQFAESVVVVMLSFILAFALTERLLPVFNNLLEKDIILKYFGSVFFLWIVVAGVIMGLISGLYPAIQILKVSPLKLLKTGANGAKQKAGFRKILVLIQFTVTASLLTILLIMVGQMNYLKQKDLGFNASAIISVPLDGDSIQSHIPLKQEFLKVSGVEKASVSGFRPGGYAYITAMDAPNEKGKGASGLGGEAIVADASFLKLMEIKVLWKVRDNVLEQFNKDQVIINKSMAQSMNILQNPEGARIYSYDDQVGKEVIAIVDDFHMKSLKDEIEPISIYYLNDWGNDNILVKIKTADLSTVLNKLSIPYEQFFGRPFEYSFLDDKIAEFYKKEQGQFKLFQIFSTIALIISLSGLVALTTYSLEQRKKEVSIRKVLGASIQNLLLLLNKEYTFLVVLAFLIASPIAYYAMQGWLAEFKYRIDISPFLFIGAFLGFLALSWMVTLLQSIKVSKENPADVLRDE